MDKEKDNAITQEHSFKERLLMLINELEVKKEKYNKFGDYNYRSCEDILNKVKPLLMKYGLLLTLQDDIIELQGATYICAIVILKDVYSNESISTKAFAKEPIEQKKMSNPQLTGSASSYARKYALNGLFCIDDTQDIDSMDNTKQSYTQIVQNKSNSNKKNEVLQELLKWATNEDKKNKISIVIAELFHKKNYSELTVKESEQLLSEIQKIDKVENQVKGTQQWM